MNVGDTFSAAEHLWVAVAQNDAGEVVVFNFTTYRPGSPGCDNSCVLEVGDHPFIKHKSAVNYWAGELLTKDQQEEIAEKVSLFRPHAAASAYLVEKIRKGAIASNQTPEKLKKIMAAHLPAADVST